MSEHLRLDFNPSARHAAPVEGERDVAVVFLGDSYVNGVGDPKGQGWVTRVVGRTQHPEVTVTAYNLGVRGNTTADVLTQWQDEVPARWVGRSERRIVLSVGTNDVRNGVSLARHRLQLANLLDDATNSGIPVFVVSPPPSTDDAVDERLAVLVEGQSDVCARRGLPFVDCFSPLVDHDQWRADVAAGGPLGHPGQAGYGLIAWLVLHNGWGEWLGLS